MNSFNLLFEPWIPVRRKSGIIESIAPWQVCETDDPPLAVVGAKADFTVAYYEFLIGLFQTAMTPNNDRAWAIQFGNQPKADALKESLERLRPAFELMNGEFRFMQEHGPPLSTEKRVEQLWLEAPGDNTIKLNKDFFVKRQEAVSLAPEAAAISLFTRQTYDNGFGGGYRGALRGPAALVTLVMGATLWETIWLNVLPRDEFGLTDVDVRADDPLVFPWMGPTRTSEKGTLPTFQNEVHPFHVFWGMPNRLQLVFEETDRECSVTGRIGGTQAVSIRAQQFGYNYVGGFNHTLSPWIERDGERDFRRGRSLTGAGGTYRSYGEMVFGSGAASSPAKVVSYFYSRGLADDIGRRTILCAGYDVSQANARGFVQMDMPLFPLDKAAIGELQTEIDRLTKAADYTENCTREAIRRAVFGKATKSGKQWSWKVNDDSMFKKTLAEQIRLEFWRSTETKFYQLLAGILNKIKSDAATTDERLQWVVTLRSEALRIFDNVANGGDFQAANPKSIVLARRELLNFLSKNNEYLDLKKGEA